MSVLPVREPFLLNKYLLAETASSFDLRRPCLSSRNFCDTSFFQRLDPTHPFHDCRFPRYHIVLRLLKQIFLYCIGSHMFMLK